MFVGFKKPERKIDLLVRSHAFQISVALALLFLGQLATGTSVSFALLILLFGVLTALTIQTLGGIGNLMGFCVAVLAAQHIFISQTAKILYNQPADLPLLQPLITAGAYDVGMASMLAAAWLWRISGLQRCKPLLRTEVESDWLFWMTLVCTVFVVVRLIILGRSGDAQTGQVAVGGAIGPLRATNFVGPLSIACGTAYTIVSTRGRRSFGWLTLLPAMVGFVNAFLGASREGMANVVVTYILTCLGMGFKYRKAHFAGFAFAAYVAQFIFFPYALEARNIARTPDIAKNFQMEVDLLVDIITNPVFYQTKNLKQQHRLSAAAIKMQYYGRANPTLDRYTLINTTDAIIDDTVQRGPIGMTTISPVWSAILPRFINPDKPISLSISNLLAHRVAGMVPKHDTTTGITIGFFTDAFSSYEWIGMAIIPFLVLFLITTVYRLIFVDAFYNGVIPIGLAMDFSWIFSGAPISSQIETVFQEPMIIVVALGSILWLVNFLVNSARRRYIPRLRPTSVGKAGIDASSGSQ